MQYRSSLYSFWLMIWLTGCLVLTLAGCSPAPLPPDTGPAGAPQASMVVKGKVSEVLVAANQLVLKPDKEQKMVLVVNQQTIYVGFASLSELERNQVLTIWYYKDGENNMAVKIERGPELGC